MGQLVAAERAARLAGETAWRWWEPLKSGADEATTHDQLDEVLSTALGAIRTALAADAASLLLADEMGDLVTRSSIGLGAAIYSNLRIRGGTGVAGKVLANRAPTLIDDLEVVELASPTLSELGMRSLVAVPVLAGERAIGVLHASSRTPCYFTCGDLDAIGLVADRLGSAIDRVDLFETERAARSQAEVSARRLARLQRITAELAGAIDREHIAAVVWNELTPGFDGAVTSCTVWLVEGCELVLVPIAGKDQPSAAERFARIPVDAELPGPHAVHTGRPIFISGIGDRDDRYPALTGTETVGMSHAVLPLAVGDQVLGVLAIGFADDRDFEHGDRDHLVAVAEVAAQAFDRARLRAAEQAAVRSQSFLLEVTRVLTATEGYEETLRRLGLVAVPTLGDLCLIDIIDDEGDLRRMVAHHADKSSRAATIELRTSYQPLLGGPHPSARAIATRTTVWSNDMPDKFLRAICRDERHFQLTKELGFTSYIAVPLVVDGEVLGAVMLVLSASDRRYGPDDVSLAETLANQVAAVVRNARSYGRERDTSVVLQRRLLPSQLPEIDGARLAFAYLPRTRGVDAGGDFYDVVDKGDGTVWLMLGDVAGHDRQAAGQMGNLRVAARTLVGHVKSPSALISALRAAWERLEIDRIATAVFCQLETSSGALRVASAGHLAPILVKSGTAEFLPVKPSTPLGGPAAAVVEWSGELAAGEALLLYSDGVIQDRERLLGVNEALSQLLTLATACPPEPAELCDRVQSAMGSDRSDDVALLSILRSPT
jgi:GAF domain-containing protein